MKKKALKITGFAALAGWMFASAAMGALHDETTWAQDLLRERAAKDAEFKTSATSPISGRERLTIPAADKRYVVVRGGAVTVATESSPDAAFALVFREGGWFWEEAAAGVEGRAEETGAALKPGIVSPGCLFRVGRLSLGAYPGPDSLALIVFDPHRPEQAAFEHLLYYPPDPRYAVPARLERFPGPSQVKVTTSRLLEKTFYRYGSVHFRLDGKDLTLTALKSALEGPGSDELFIPFKDATNGGETYEVGRFLDVKEPDGDALILDFNRCYNPLCNYSPAYNCPMPPLENILKIGIPAGEKTYPHE
ncbi:MAG TPA: DUF1684 domain-containing protein [Candidatus Aminicenantes bacterium]|jgi:Uncharacterized conserved protein|nr:MAG: hypothetical protein BWX98_00426 [Candidatus Aminicenantes bacterium ADurb.Bin147]HOY97769.1 DUF1684 domain-containing protein [Candidatus Aminicenantes bacterium]HPH43356.1 DUF1684 domain-containing protein [Candidatus Aminicenantes bacterium]HPN17177.1 DUF1684 domain-containing protein [Candidatus Aminicenantes bacterium]